MPLVSVDLDINTHGAGQLSPTGNTKVFAGGKLVNHLGSVGRDDNRDHPTGATDAASASSKVFVQGIPVHRGGDLRFCGAQTVVVGQSKVSAG